MSYEFRAYDNDHGDPVVVLVTTGTHDVSRLVNLLAGSRLALVEHMDVSEKIRKQVRRHNGGRAALQLLAAHGGPDLRDLADPDRKANRRASITSDEDRFWLMCDDCHARIGPRRVHVNLAALLRANAEHDCGESTEEAKTDG